MMEEPGEGASGDAVATNCAVSTSCPSFFTKQSVKKVHSMVDHGLHCCATICAACASCPSLFTNFVVNTVYSAVDDGLHCWQLLARGFLGKVICDNFPTELSVAIVEKSSH